MYRTKKQGLLLSGMFFLAIFVFSRTLPPLSPSRQPPDIQLAVNKEQITLADGFIGFRIINNTGDVAYTRTIPSLQRKVGNRWEYVPLNVAFCGTPDSVNPKGYKGKFPLSWCEEPPAPGCYRLAITDWERNQYYAEFEIT